MQNLRQFEFFTLAIKISFLFGFLHGCPLKCLSVHALLKDEIVATVGVRFSEGEISLLYPRKVDAGDADYKFNSI